MKTTIFKIEGMNCDGCADTIKNLVEKEPGVHMASVSFAEKQACAVKRQAKAPAELDVRG